ncbi:glutaredoxin family protein [Halomonas sp. WWR20]
MSSLTLYTTLGCHLCEQLEAHLAEHGKPEISVEKVEISEDPALVARYGERIPVLADRAGHELERGFEHQRLTPWLAARGLLRDAGDERHSGEATRPAMGHHLRRGRRYLK